jgi:hypothetical protein
MTFLDTLRNVWTSLDTFGTHLETFGHFDTF